MIGVISTPRVHVWIYKQLLDIDDDDRLLSLDSLGHGRHDGLHFSHQTSHHFGRAFCNNNNNNDDDDTSFCPSCLARLDASSLQRVETQDEWKLSRRYDSCCL